MKKSSLILGGICLIILISLLMFVSMKTYDDGHLRSEGVRVKVPEDSLAIESCDEKSAIYCKKTFNINGQNVVLEFAYKKFKENGYPDSLVVSLNNHEFLKKDGLSIETLGSSQYQMFNNFKVMDDLIVFTYTDGNNGLTSTLYAIDLEGNIILNETNIDDMKLKDYTTFISYEKNTITVYTTKLIQDILYKDKNICEAPKKDIVEAYYTYTLKNNKFTKKQTKKITAEEFIKNNKINCSK